LVIYFPIASCIEVAASKASMKNTNGIMVFPSLVSGGAEAPPVASVQKVGQSKTFEFRPEFLHRMRVPAGGIERGSFLLSAHVQPRCSRRHPEASQHVPQWLVAAAFLRSSAGAA